MSIIKVKNDYDDALCEHFEEKRRLAAAVKLEAATDIIKKLIYYNLKHSFDIAASNHVYAIGYDQPIMVTIPHDTIEGSGLTYRHVVENLYTRLLDMENEAGKASSDREEN